MSRAAPGAFQRIVVFALILCVSRGGFPIAASAEASLIAGLDDLADKRIGVLQASVQDLYASEHFPDARISRFLNQADTVTALRADKVDAVIAPYLQLREAQKLDDSLVFLPDKILSVPVGAAFHKENPELRDKFNAFLRQIQADGTLDDLLGRYWDDDNFAMPEIAADTRNGKLNYGVTASIGLPFVSISAGEFVGLEIELARRFAADLEMELVIRDIEFTGLIASLATGKVDMIGGGVAITEERQRQVDFSDPVYEVYSVAMTRRDKADTQAVNRTQYGDETIAPPEASADEGGSEIKGPRFLAKLTDSFYRNIILEQRYLLILHGLCVTVVLSLLALVFGTALGAAVCAARMGKNAPLKRAAKVYIALLRGVPVLVVLMIIYYIVFASVNIDPFFVATIAFGMNFAAYVAEMFRAGIESVDGGQREAGIAGGFTPRQTFWYITLPQAARRILPVYKGEFISLVKMTSVVGYIAVQDLTKAGDIIRSRTMEAFFPLIMVAFLYFLVSWLLTSFLSDLERRVDPRSARTGGAS